MIYCTENRDRCRVERAGIIRPSYERNPLRLIFAASECRIDNLAELERACGIDANSDLETLFIAGWRQWGTDLAGKLRGAFAFVLHDSQSGRLYAARDHFGLAPLFTAHKDDTLFFARSSRAVRSMLEEAPGDDTLTLADAVHGLHIERTRTYFTGIERFPVASWKTYDRNGDRQRKYWSIASAPKVIAPVAPADRFRSLLNQSVKNCVVPEKTALMLSGGLDSSAIAGSAASPSNSPLLAFSLTYKQTPGWCDNQHLFAVARMTGLNPIEVPSDRHDPLMDMEFWLQAVDGPCLACGHSVSFALLRRARTEGASIVLSGHGGDEVVSYGFGRLNELARARQWLALWRETAAVSDLYGDARARIFVRYLAHIKRMRPLTRALNRFYSQKSEPEIRYLDDRILDKLGHERYFVKNAMDNGYHDDRMIQEEALGIPLQSIALDIFSECSSAVGVEARHPFFNVDLVEFSLSLPSDWKLRDGYSRYILRQAYAGDLPEITLKRRDKFDFSGAFIAGLVDQREKVLDLTGPGPADRWGLVNRESLNAARDTLYRNGTGLDRIEAFFLWRVAILAMWAEISRIPLDTPVMKEVI